MLNHEGSIGLKPTTLRYVIHEGMCDGDVVGGIGKNDIDRWSYAYPRQLDSPQRQVYRCVKRTVVLGASRHSIV